MKLITDIFIILSIIGVISFLIMNLEILFIIWCIAISWIIIQYIKFQIKTIKK